MSAQKQPLLPSTMHITLNGQPHTLQANTSIQALLEVLGHLGKRLAVERNGAIVPRSQHADTILLDSDALEIVIAVGGG